MKQTRRVRLTCGPVKKLHFVEGQRGQISWGRKLTEDEEPCRSTMQEGRDHRGDA